MQSKFIARNLGRFRIYRDLNCVILILILFTASNLNAQNTMWFNNGVDVQINEITFQNNGHFQNQFGNVNNNGVIYIIGNIINNDSLIALPTQPQYFISGDWINNQFFNPENSDVVLNGGNQIINGQATTFYNLSLENGQIKTQEIDVEILGVLNLNSSELELQNNSISILNDAENAIQRSSGFVSNIDGGYLSRNMENGVYLFPMGSRFLNASVPLRPIEISTNNDAVFAIGFFPNNATNQGYDTDVYDDSLCHVNEKFYHKIKTIQSNGNVQLNSFYQEQTDGYWDAFSNWNQEWKLIKSSSLQNGNVSFNGVNFKKVNILNWQNQNDSIFAFAKRLPEFTASISNSLTCLAHQVDIQVNSTNQIPIDSVVWSQPIPNNAIIIPQVQNGQSIVVNIQQSAASIIMLPYEVFEDGCSRNDTIKIEANQQYEVKFDTLQSTTCDEINVGIMVDTIRTLEGCDSLIQTTIVSLDDIESTTIFNDECNIPDTTYTDSLTSASGCDSLVIYVFECALPDTFTINLPTAFTPNGDEENDELKAYSNRELDNFFIEVFDRWGERVFASDNVDEGWDGTFKGKMMSVGVFLVVVEAQKGNNKKRIVENIKLLK